MNGEPEYASPKSPMNVALWIGLIIAVAVAIMASVVASRRGTELNSAKRTVEQLKQEYDQAQINIQAREADVERKTLAAEELRRVALGWKDQYSAKVDALNKAKAPTPTKSTTPSKSSSSSSKSKSSSSKSYRR